LKVENVQALFYPKVQSTVLLVENEIIGQN